MPRCYWTISSNPNSHKCFYSVCHHIYFPSGAHRFASPIGFYPSSYYAIKLKGGCSRLFILHIRLCLYSFYEATSSLRISHNPSFVFLLSEDSSHHSTYQTMLTILLVSYYHSAQNVCRPKTVAVCNNGVVYMPS